LCEISARLYLDWRSLQCIIPDAVKAETLSVHLEDERGLPKIQGDSMLSGAPEGSEERFGVN
jgi:hypothetical protein